VYDSPLALAGVRCRGSSARVDRPRERREQHWDDMVARLDKIAAEEVDRC
jgi:hypothetical protein